MAEEDKKSQPFYIYLVPLVLIFLISYFLIRPSILDARTEKKEVLTQEKILEQKKKTISKFKETSEKYQSFSSEIEKLNKVIFSEADLPRLFFQLESLAVNNGLILTNISFSGISSGDGFGTISTNLQLTGSYQSFKNYLRALTTNIPLIDVQNIIFQGDADEDGRYSYSLTVNSYANVASKISVEKPKPEEKSTEENKENKK